ncbi:uncharacterized protein LOC118512561 [Anopheles stephensi]|uniref:uncharacterized protein LOC118512561 n=1 Tax=Anopheles stephensi TaxID=30069 RepID=UPI0016589925|nr:uncharacterized protein LOC118512561 [Anopheles stephensi]
MPEDLDIHLYRVACTLKVAQLGILTSCRMKLISLPILKYNKQRNGESIGTSFTSIYTISALSASGFGVTTVPRMSAESLQKNVSSTVTRTHGKITSRKHGVQ